MRTLTAVLSAGQGEFVLDGSRRMRERPIGDLVDALKQVGRYASDGFHTANV